MVQSVECRSDPKIKRIPPERGYFLKVDPSMDERYLRLKLEKEILLLHTCGLLTVTDVISVTMMREKRLKRPTMQ